MLELVACDVESVDLADCDMISISTLLSPLHLAANLDKNEAVDHLLQAEATPNVLNVNGQTPQFRTIVPVVMDGLLVNGTDDTIINRSGQNLVGKCVKNNSPEVAHHLVSIGPKFDNLLRSGSRNVYICLQRRRRESFFYFEQNGLDRYQSDHNGHTPRKITLEFGSRILPYILSSGILSGVVVPLWNMLSGMIFNLYRLK